MPIITLTTDFGLKDAYVAALKAKIFNQLKSPDIVDVTHLIDPFHINQAAYILGSIYQKFPEGSIHFVGVDLNRTPDQKIIVALLKNHYFICADNGFLSLIESGTIPTQIISLNPSDKSNHEQCVEAISHIYRGGSLNLIGSPLKIFKQLTQHTPLINNKEDEIQGNVIHIDVFGNVITNISKQLFKSVAKKRDFLIHARNHKFDRIFDDYSDAIKFDKPKNQREEDGKKLAIFNNNDLIELAIYKGSPNYGGGASTLFGLYYLDPIRIEFINQS